VRIRFGSRWSALQFSLSTNPGKDFCFWNKKWRSYKNTKKSMNYNRCLLNNYKKTFIISLLWISFALWNTSKITKSSWCLASNSSKNSSRIFSLWFNDIYKLLELKLRLSYTKSVLRFPLFTTPNRCIPSISLLSWNLLLFRLWLFKKSNFFKGLLFRVSSIKFIFLFLLSFHFLFLI